MIILPQLMLLIIILLITILILILSFILMIGQFFYHAHDRRRPIT